jgi:hypothetical protein
MINREIAVSTDVYARIWSLRKPGEDDEDSILRRILWSQSSENASQATPTGGQPPEAVGFLDERHGVVFPDGFEIFRVYLGREYRARAIGGTWRLAGRNDDIRSLNSLSRAIGAKTENAWQNWFYRAGGGSRRAISDLRPQRAIAARSERPAAGSQTEIKSDIPLDHQNVEDDVTWRDDVYNALEQIGRKGPLHEIYKTTRKIRIGAGRSVPRTLEGTIRRTLEDNSSDSANYKGGPDLFRMSEGKGAGIWALR